MAGPEGGEKGVVAAISWGAIVGDVEEAKYTVITTDGKIEIRDYAPMIVAETEVVGQRDESINKGFRLVADYIFGNNTASQKVAMTTPVTQQTSEKISMTAPVTQQGDGTSWKVRFTMPANHTMGTLPKPNNAAVKLIEIPGSRFATIRFSGLAGAENLRLKTDELQLYAKSKNIKTVSTPTYAFYNPPWTLPFMRRNEVMLEIVK